MTRIGLPVTAVTGGCDCGSCPFYQQNPAATEPVCSGCNTDCGYCGCTRHVTGSCGACSVRCRSRVDLDAWLADVGGTVTFDDIDLADLELPARLPRFVPQVDTTEITRLDADLSWPAYAIGLRRVISATTYDLLPAWRDTTARDALGLSDSQLAVLVGYVKDPLVEAFWTRRQRLCLALADQAWDLVLAPNYSAYGNFPRMEMLLNFRRNLLVAQEMLDVGIPAVPNLYSFRLEDLERYATWLDDIRPPAVAVNLQTLRDDESFFELAYPALAYLAAVLPEPTRLIITRLIPQSTDRPAHRPVRAPAHHRLPKPHPIRPPRRHHGPQRTPRRPRAGPRRLRRERPVLRLPARRRHAVGGDEGGLMPTKGRSRAHESIRLAPATPHRRTVRGPVGGQGGGGISWEETPDYTHDPAAEAPEALAVRRYRGEAGTEVVMPNVTGLRDMARSDSGEAVDIANSTVLLPLDGSDEVVAVGGPVRVTHQGGLRYQVDDAGFECSVRNDLGHGEDCEHRARASEAVRAVMEARRIRSALTEWEQATGPVAATLAEDHRRSEEARQQPADAPDDRPWADHPEAFQSAYQAALDRRAAGQAPVPYMTQNATGGLASRDGGRGFGVELEFDFAPGINHRAALAAIGRDLYDAGLTSSPHQQGYHRGQGSPNWRFETDSTVAGEVVSPVLHDEPQTWTQLQQVCDILRRHGARATPRTGGHVHVGVGDFDHDPENHTNLLGLYGQHEDVVYRLAQNPAASAHRGRLWCQPNRIPAAGYSNVRAVQFGNAHGNAINFQAVSGNVTDHVEFRMWDGSLDPGVIQAQVNLSLGVTDAAFRTERGTAWGHERIGHHRQHNRGQHRDGRLEGETWLRNTSSLRQLVDRVFTRSTNREQAAALFAVTRWQHP